MMKMMYRFMPCLVIQRFRVRVTHRVGRVPQPHLLKGGVGHSEGWCRSFSPTVVLPNVRLSIMNIHTCSFQQTFNSLWSDDIVTMKYTDANACKWMLIRGNSILKAGTLNKQKNANDRYAPLL